MRWKKLQCVILRGGFVFELGHLSFLEVDHKNSKCSEINEIEKGNRFLGSFLNWGCLNLPLVMTLHG